MSESTCGLGSGSKGRTGPPDSRLRVRPPFRGIRVAGRRMYASAGTDGACLWRRTPPRAADSEASGARFPLGPGGFRPPGPLPSAERQGRRGTEEGAPESEQRQKGYIIGAFQRLMGSHWGRYANSSETDCVKARSRSSQTGNDSGADRCRRQSGRAGAGRILPSDAHSARRRFRTRMRVRTRSGRGAGPRGGPDRHFRGPARAGRRCRRSRH